LERESEGCVVFWSVQGQGGVEGSVSSRAWGACEDAVPRGIEDSNHRCIYMVVNRVQADEEILLRELVLLMLLCGLR